MGAPAVLAKASFSKDAVHASVRAIDQVVGLFNEAARLHVLELRLPASVAADALLAEASEQFKNHFSAAGIEVWYTRKYYEQVEWKLFGTIPKRPISSIKLVGGLETELLADARRFIDPTREAEYVRFGRPYKRVYCLHGPPGTGKTSIVLSVASELDRPVAIFNVDSLRDDTFIELLSDLPPKAVIVFEDVDALFKSRVVQGGEGGGKKKEVKQNSAGAAQAGGGPDDGGMTFSTLLNALDGVLHPRGAIVFMTTNHVDRLDPALHRPGRVDRMLEVLLARSAQVAELWKIAFPKGPPLPRDLARAVNRGNGVSPALTTEVLFQTQGEGAAATGAALAAVWAAAAAAAAVI